MSSFATGKYALGTCDRCGFTVAYLELRPQVYNLRQTGLMVCPDCLDIDHEQLQIGRVRVDDPQALRNGRPDTGALDSRGQFGWNPVGSLVMTASVGTVTVLIA